MTPNKERIKLWVDALRSGEYQQGKDALRSMEDDGIKHCCLAVACDIASKVGGIGRWAEDGIEFNVDGIHRTDMPHPEVGQWFGVKNIAYLPKRVPVDQESGIDAFHSDFLPELNDDYGFTFAQIAGILEAQYLRGEA